MNKPKTLKSKLTLNILLVSLLPMILGMIAVLIFLATYVYDNRLEDQNQRLEYVESNMNLMFKEMGSVLDEADYNIENGIVDQGKINAYLDVLLDKYVIFDTIRLVDIHGDIINAPRNEKDIIGFNLSYQDYYKGSLERYGLQWSNVFLSPETSEISLAVSIHNSDGTMLIGYCSLLELQNLIGTILLEKNENIAIVDQEGVYIAHNDFKRVEQRQLEKHFKELGDIKTLKVDYDSNKTYIMSRGLPQQNLTVISYFNYFQTYRIIWNVIYVGLFCILIIIFLTILISRFNSNPIIQEIKEIIKKTGEISTGKYGTNLERSHLLEFDELSHNFNVMSGTIQESFIQLSDAQAETEILNEELIAQNDEIRQSEQQITTIINNIYEGIMVIDERCNVLWINDSVFEIFNIDKVEMINKKKCYHFIYNMDSKCYYCDMDTVKQSNEKVSRVIKVNDRQIEETYIPVYDQDDRFSGVIKTFRDITEKVLLESKLNAAIKMEAIGRLTGGIAHDFNNILQVIIGYSELVIAQMNNSVDVSNLIPKMGIINDAATKAERLIKQLMTFSKIDQTNPVNLNLNQVVREVGAMLTNVLGEGIDLKLSLDQNISDVYADRVQIEQVIMNLCMNAKHAMQDGGTLSIETHNSHKGNILYCTLKITDTGAGIPEQFREKIFDPFFTTKEMGKGTGLGLAIVLGIIEKHDGHIQLESKVEEGTTFTILLPAAERKAKILIKDDHALDYSPLKGLKVLVAEDEDSIRTIAVTALKGYGVTVIEAIDGREAISLYNKQHETFDLLILDVIMPGVNGVEVYDQIKKIQPEIKVIFTTGYSRDFLGEDFNLSLQGRILHKPYKIKMLMNTILEVLEL